LEIGREKIAQSPEAASPDASHISKWTLKSSHLYAIVIRMSEPTGTPAMSTTVLSVRVSQEERAILEAASEQAHTSLSEFVRRKAVDAAESDMLDRRIVTIPAKDWEAFEAWASRPAQDRPALKELAAKAPTWRR
jgi:uncharacterized protein (DUF1778 family)